MTALWPYQPLDGMLEGVAWRTDVIRSRAGEQRIRLTDIPRRTFSHTYRFTARQYERARSQLRAELPGAFWLPDWSEWQRASVASGAVSLAVDTTAAQYVVGGRVVIWQDDETAEIRTISSVSPANLGVDAVQGNYSNALVMPAFEACAPQGLQLGHEAGPSKAASMEWTVYGGADWSDDGDPLVYRGDPVLQACAQVGAEALPESVTREVFQLDNGIARPFFDDMLDDPIQTLGAAWVTSRGAGTWALRRWFHYLKGRQRAFWLPAWNRGVELVADVVLGDLTLQIRDIGFASAYGAGDLFIRLRNGLVYALQVTSAVDGGSTETLTLASPAPAAFGVDEVEVACLMFRVRLAADRVEFSHNAGFGARVVVPCVEVPL